MNITNCVTFQVDASRNMYNGEDDDGTGDVGDDASGNVGGGAVGAGNV